MLQIIYLDSAPWYTYRLAQPDSQKGVMEQTGDMMSGAMDSAASALQPNVNFLSYPPLTVTNSFFFTIEPEVRLPESQRQHDRPQRQRRR